MGMTRVVVGRIGRPHGVRGEVTIEVRTDEPDLRFAAGSSLLIQDDAHPALVIDSTRDHSGVLQIKFEGINDRTAAESIRNLILEALVDETELPFEEDEYYDRQLIGLAVLDSQDREIGEVVDVLHLPGHDVLSIQTDGQKELLVPFVAEFVPVVDIAQGLVVITPPAGLLELNEPTEKEAAPDED